MRLVFRGVVQGVGFRPSAYRAANALGLSGYIRNNGSNVEVWIDRFPDEFVERLKKELPSLARIDEIIKEDVPANEDDYVKGKFVILHSREGKRDSPIPPDTALCDDCIKELFDEKNRRYMYPFTNCTNCGARFSVIEDIPYDRENTSMRDFPMCKACENEYNEPLNRRFYAQTTSCPEDGPKYELYSKDGQVIETNEIEGPFRHFANAINDGKFGVMKTWGGMHIICRVDKISELRKWYHRPSKPFAIMVRDLAAARKYANISSDDERVMTSFARPITLVKKKFEVEKNGRTLDEESLELLSPGLETVGMYLPYGAAHHILFAHLRTDAIISTSANVPGEPMIIENKDAFVLGADVYLLHNRRIIARCDDSVAIPFRGNSFLIRKSRGYVPLPIVVGYNGNILSLGAQQNLTSSVSSGGMLYTTQYLGNAERYEVQRSLERSTEHMMRLSGVELEKIDGLGCDLHPGYSTRRYLSMLEEKTGMSAIPVQHHFAHAVALMVDANLTNADRMLCLAIDGAGYGADGTIWGCELLEASYVGYERLCSLELLPLIGGDLSAENPKMFVFGICEKLGICNEILQENDAEMARKAMARSPQTSSFGRVLDGISYILGACRERTYDGEPAMRLEKYLSQGKELARKNGRFADEFKIEFADNGLKRIRTLPMFERLISLSNNADMSKKMELAYVFVDALVGEFANIAVERARERGLRKVGLSGGVSYDIPIVEMFAKRIESAGLELALHSRVPNGDAGVSVGQNAHIGYKLQGKA